MLAVSPARQLWNVSLSVGVPVLGTLAALALALLTTMPVPPVAWALLVVGYVLTGVGVEVGIHRHFVHRAFAAKPWLRVLLGALGCTAAQGPVLYWTATHRRHHAHADTIRDPHSPERHGGLRGFWYAHVGWMFDTEHNQLVLEHVDTLARDPVVRWVDRRYGLWVALGFLLPTIIAGLWTGTLAGALMGFLWGGCVRLLVAQHMVFAVNSLGHIIGRQTYQTTDSSRDIALLAPLSFGGTLHNTHHAFQYTANNASTWFTVDTGYWVIRGCQALGWVWDVKQPSDHQRARRRR